MPTRRWLAREGAALFREAVAQAAELADQIHRLPASACCRPTTTRGSPDHSRDPLRLVVNVAGAGWTGYDAELLLRTEYTIEDELADWFNVALVLSPHDDPAARTRLLAGLKHVSDNPRARPESSIAEAANLLQPAIPPLAMTPARSGAWPEDADRARPRASAACAPKASCFTRRASRC